MHTDHPSIVTTDENAFFWQQPAEPKRLRIQRCTGCRWLTHPPRPVCPHCGGRTSRPDAMSGRAVVYSFTVVRRQFHPAFADDLPYVLALVELLEQPALRLLSRIVACSPEQVYVEMPLEVDFERRGDFWLPVFAPLTSGRRT